MDNTSISNIGQKQSLQKKSLQKEFLQIRYCKLNITITLAQDATLPMYKVSMLRGGIGEMLLQGNCICGRECEGCSFAEECVVQQIYYHKLKIVPDYVQGKESLGYLYECADTRTHFRRGDTLAFQMLLFGNVIVHFPVILQAIYRLGRFGLGKGRAAFKLTRITNQRGEEVFVGNQACLSFLMPDTLQDYVRERGHGGKAPAGLCFVTPWTQKYEGNFLKEDIPADALIDSIYRRIYLLHCMEGIPMERSHPYRGCLRLGRQEIRLETRPRYSGTQDGTIYLKGIGGNVEIQKIDKNFLDFLIAGELVHIGKNTTMGFGRYRLLF